MFVDMSVRTFSNILKLSDSIAIVLLVVWVLNVLHPFAPYISDFAQHHIKSSREHSLLHSLGIQHVDNEISKIVSQQQEDDGKESRKISLESPFQFFSSTQNLTFFPLVQNIGFMFMFFEHEYQFNTRNFPPPKPLYNQLIG